MRHLFITVIIAMAVVACKNTDQKGKEPVNKDSATVGPVTDTTTMKPAPDSTVITDTVKTVNLTYSGYEEGDYPHLMFTETETGKEYDFGHPDENNLKNIPVVIKDSNAAFGYKENSKMKGAKFIANILYKMTDTYDDNGQPVKGKEWRITGIKRLND